MSQQKKKRCGELAKVPPATLGSSATRPSGPVTTFSIVKRALAFCKIFALFCVTRYVTRNATHTPILPQKWSNSTPDLTDRSGAIVYGNVYANTRVEAIGGAA